ncbi:MAG: dipeptidase [Bryobacteraceae bacterium]
MRLLIAALVALPLAAQVDEARLSRLLDSLLIFDAHIDTPRYFVDEGYRLADEHDYYELDLPRLRKGHVGAVLFGLYAQPEDFQPRQWLPRVMECLEALHREVEANRNDMEFASTADDILRIRRAGKVAVLASLEGGHLFEDNLYVLGALYRLGVRYVTLAHFHNSTYADSMTDAPKHDGLSPAGRELIAWMNRAGMMVDVSHISDKAVVDAVAASRAPVIASHSSVKSISPIPRNMPDETMKAVASKGGVICLNFHAGYLDPKAHAVYIKNRPKRVEEINAVLSGPGTTAEKYRQVRRIQAKYYDLMPPVPIAKLVDHLDYIAKNIGVDHVGLGSDFDGVSGMVPRGMEDVSKYPAIVRGLMARGYSDEEIRKIMGMNLIRVMKANEAVAAELR